MIEVNKILQPQKARVEKLLSAIQNEIISSTSTAERCIVEKILKNAGIQNIESFAFGILFYEDGTDLGERPSLIKNKLERIPLFEADDKTISTDGKLMLKTMLLLFKALSKLAIEKGHYAKFKNMIEQKKKINAAENYLYPNRVAVYSKFFDQVLEIHTALGLESGEGPSAKNITL